MFSSRIFSSARTRFLATAATVFALVALGGVVATPAHADAAALRIIDASTGNVWAYGNFVLTSTGGGDTSITTDGSGYYTHFITDGDYYISSTGSNATVPSDVFNIHVGQTYYDVYVDTYKVSGTIPTDADEGLTAVSVQYHNGASWGPVGVTLDPVSVVSSDGSFLMRAPQGPGQYRLVFQPDASTPYTETIVPFTVDGSVAIVALGAVSLNQEAAISGTVYEADGVTALSGATVHATVAGSDVATGTSDGTGAYSIPLPPGDADYDVWAEASKYDDSSAQTVSVNATDGYVHSGIDFALDVDLVELTGTVLNSNSFGGDITVQLYSGGTASPALLDEVVTDRPGGTYSFADVSAIGNYFLKFIPANTDAFLDTLVGDAGATEWSKDTNADALFSVDHSFTVDPDTASSLVHDVTIGGAAVLRGYLTSYGIPVDGCVIATDVSDPTSTICARGDGDGFWIIRVPAGGTYTLHATDGFGEYTEDWWENADSALDATEIGPVTLGFYGDYNFGLQPSPAAINVTAQDVADPDPITVHLYFKDGGNEWREAGVATTDPGGASFTTTFFENYYTGVPDGLMAGDYRVRFQDSNGMWLATAGYYTGFGQDTGGTSIVTATCFIDLPDVTQGLPTFINATFDAGNQTEVCGPQPLNFGDVSGHVITSGAYGSIDVGGHAVYLTDDSGYDWTVTDTDGTFVLSNQPNGVYTLEVLPEVHVPGEHEYGLTVTNVTLTGGNVDLGTFVATRFGNVTGQISNWNNSTMNGAVATVYHKVTDVDGDHWLPGPLDVPISSTGTFEVPGIDASTEYALLISFSDTYAPVFIGGGFPVPSSSFTGVAEQDYNLGLVTVDVDELVTISGTAFFGTEPLLAGVVIAHPVGADESIFFYGTVDTDGSYTVEVAPNVDYWVAAVDIIFSPPLLMQFYGGSDYPVDLTCGCGFDFDGTYDFETVEVDTDDVEDINFSLIAADDVIFDFEILSWDEPTDDYADFEDVEVHLYKYVVDGWEEVDMAISDPYAYIEASGSGDYRVRFWGNGDWLAVHDIDGGLSYPYADDLEVSEEFDPAQCYVDFDDVQNGSYVWTSVSLIGDPSTTSCGPQVLADHNEIVGVVETTALWGNDRIPGQDLTLTNDTTHAVFSTTTDVNGVYLFENVPQGTYTLTAPTMPFPFVGMTFAPATVGGIIVDGDEALDPVELTSYGAAFVQITNWDSAMAGATAQLAINHPDLSGDHWTLVGLVDTVDPGGHFLVPGIAEDGEYSVWIDYPTGFVDTYLTDVTSATNIISFNGYAEYNQTGLDTLAYTSVSGIVRLGAAAVAGASISVESPYGDLYPATTAANGTYTVAVPADQTYSVYATKSGLVRDIITTLVVPFAPAVNQNLELHYATFLTELYAGAATPTAATVHLYKQVSGGWQEVASDTGSTAFLWANLAGSYRMRFSDGANWLAVSAYEWDNLAGSETSGLVQPLPNVCVIDFSPAIAGAEYHLSAVVHAPPTGVVCAAEPAVVAPPVTPGATGAGKTHEAEPETVADEEATDEPTPTPTPEPGESAPDEPADAATDKPTTASSPDLTWAFWLAGLLALLVLCGGAFFVIRRRP